MERSTLETLPQWKTDHRLPRPPHCRNCCNPVRTPAAAFPAATEHSFQDGFATQPRCGPLPQEPRCPRWPGSCENSPLSRLTCPESFWLNSWGIAGLVAAELHPKYYEGPAATIPGKEAFAKDLDRNCFPRDSSGDRWCTSSPPRQLVSWKRSSLSTGPTCSSLLTTPGNRQSFVTGGCVFQRPHRQAGGKGA